MIALPSNESRHWARAAVTHPVTVLSASFALVVLIAFADHVTGFEIRLAILYLAPIAWSTWRLGGPAGAAVAVAAALCWLVTFESNHPYTHSGYFYLEGLATFATFLIIVVLLARLHGALERSDARLITVLEGLDAAVEVEDSVTGERLYENRRYSELFGARSFAQDAGELHDGEKDRWYALRSRALRWIDGRAAKLRMLSDITDERRARDVVARQLEVAHRTSRHVALGEFASAVAHELNQPLTATATYNDACLRLLDARDFDVGELREAMRKCRDQARRAGAILARLREMLRHPVPAPVRVDLFEVAHAVCQLAQTEALEAGVSLDIEHAPALPMVLTDRLLVEQVALNLVRNAIEAVQDLAPERKRVTVAVTAESGDSVTLSVLDQGEGVPAEIRDQLFQAFVTTKATGLGLGLSICRSVIESLGGVIACRGGEGRGARFSFSLPVESRADRKTGVSTSSGGARTGPSIGFSLSDDRP
jgi:C4-dicarboxylate-specific signal transduction histidine kinase